MRAFVLLAILLAAPSAGRAHEAPSGQAYSLECCSNKDCAPLPDGAVRIVPGGYQVEDEFVAQNDERIRPSTDGAYHTCRFHPLHAGTRIRCFYVPPSGS